MAAPDEETETQSNVSEVCLYDFGPEKYDDSPEDDTLRFIEQLDQLSSGPPTEIKEIPLQLEKELVFAYRETYLQGRIKTQQVEPLGEKWYDCLSSDCANTFKNVFGARQHISLGQDWIHTMILEDYPGILHSEDREVGDAMVFAACARLYSRKIFSIGQNPDLSEFEIELSLSDKDLSSKTPYSIIICRTEDEAWSIGRLVERLLPAGIFWDHANENLIETENEEQHKHASLVIGTVHCVNVYLKKFLINTGSVESIYLTGSELYSPGSRRERSLMEIISYVRRQRSGHISSFLISATASPLTPVCRHLLSDNYSVVAIPKKTDVVLPDVKICLINTDDPGCHFFKKLACLMALVQKNINEDPKTKKTTIIVCEKEETCNFFATFLTLKFQIKVLLITRNIHPLEFERTKNLFYARVSDFLVMDYHALRFLESGDFAKIIAFDLPKPVEFSTKMGTFFRLSQKVTREKVVYLIMDPNVDRQLIVPVHKLLEKLGSRISTTFHALYVSLSVL